MTKLISEFLSELVQRKKLINFGSKLPNIELISIHIPKTAGTSFRNVLESVYGEKMVVRMDINKHKPPPKQLCEKDRVIHGHLRVPDLVKIYDININTPVITWMREPVDRLISNYFYLQKIYRDIISKETSNINFITRMEKSLMEYAHAEKNRMSYYLKGVCLRDLYFIGIKEYFSEDLADLACMMGWQKYKEYTYNTSKELNVNKTYVDKKTREEINKLNSIDVELYKEVLALRKIRQIKIRRDQ